MDLNLFYSRHQIALIKAGVTTIVSERDRHLDDASALACQINIFQRALGAPASASWHKVAMADNEAML